MYFLYHYFRIQVLESSSSSRYYDQATFTNHGTLSATYFTLRGSVPPLCLLMFGDLLCNVAYLNLFICRFWTAPPINSFSTHTTPASFWGRGWSQGAKWTASCLPAGVYWSHWYGAADWPPHSLNSTSPDFLSPPPFLATSLSASRCFPVSVQPNYVFMQFWVIGKWSPNRNLTETRLVWQATLCRWGAFVFRFPALAQPCLW